MKDLIQSFLELVALLFILAGLTYFQYWKAGKDWNCFWAEDPVVCSAIKTKERHIHRSVKPTTSLQSIVIEFS